jgi:hypothetical protein
MGRWREGNPILLSPTKEREGEYLPHLLRSLLFFPFAHLSIQQQQRWLPRPTSPFSPIFAFSCHPPARPHFLSFVPPIPIHLSIHFPPFPLHCGRPIRPTGQQPFPLPHLSPKNCGCAAIFMLQIGEKSPRRGKQQRRRRNSNQSIQFIPFGFPTSFQLEKQLKVHFSVFNKALLSASPPSHFFIYVLFARPYSFSPPLFDRSIISPSFEVDWQRSARSFWSPLNSLGLSKFLPTLQKNCNFTPFSKF